MPGVSRILFDLTATGGTLPSSRVPILCISVDRLKHRPAEDSFADQSREFDMAALNFARVCLCQPASYLADDSRRVFVKPDGYNSGPEAFADREYIDYDDIGDVLPIVAYWCHLNTVELNILFSHESYVCRLIEGNPVNQVFETSRSANVCFELLSACWITAGKMKNVNPPRASMTVSDFRRGQPPEE
jgi:hypothetical protein